MVAIVATRGRWQKVSTGYVISPQLVLTAAHGLAVGDPAMAATDVRVVHLTASSKITSQIRSTDADVAGLILDDELGLGDVEPVRWGRVDRSSSSRLLTAEAIGYPLWQTQVVKKRPILHDLAELRGVIRPVEGSGSRLLTIRDRDLESAGIPAADEEASPWGGLSGAAVFTENGYLLGIIVEHRPHDGRAALRILPIDSIAATPSADNQHLARLLQISDATSLPWAYPDPLNALADAYRTALRLAPPKGLQDREKEFAYLHTRLRRDAWTWVVADAFAGKTALLATLVTDRPRGLAIASCFIRRREGQASAEYVLDTLTSQLAALAWATAFSPQPHEKAEHFRRMLGLAAEACARRGDRLLVVVDGLDEYDPHASVPLQTWLPNQLPEGAAFLAAGRPSREPVGMHLRDDPVNLMPFTGAGDAWEAAHQELEHALRSSDPLARMVSTYLAATDGGLTEDELAVLCTANGLETHALQIASLVDACFDRTLIRVATDDDPTISFAHDAYSMALKNLLGERHIHDARDQLDRWIDPMRTSGWPQSSVRFALRPYGKHLRARLDEARETGQAAAVQKAARRLTSTISSVNRWIATFRAEGTPVAGDAEVVESVQALQQAAAAGLIDPTEATIQTALIGLSRGVVRGRIAHVAEPVAYLWALDGHLDRASELANAIREPDGRGYALAAVAAGAAEAGRDISTVEALSQAAIPEADRSGVYRNEVEVRLAEALGRAGRFATAAEVAGRVEWPDRRARATAGLARGAAEAGQNPLAVTLAGQVTAIPIVNNNPEGFWAAGLAAEALTLCGDHDGSRRVIEVARAAVDTGRAEWDRKYRGWSRRIVDVAELRCRALEQDSATTMPLDEPANDLAFSGGATRIRHDAWTRAHVAAAWSRRRPVAAAALAASTVTGISFPIRPMDSQEASWIGATPAGVTGLYIEAGLLDAALSILDSPFGFSWGGEPQGLRARLVHQLGRAGRLDDAERLASTMDEEGVRLRALAWAGASCLAALRRGDPVPAYLEPRARALVSDALTTAAAAELRDRAVQVRSAIGGKLFGVPAAAPDPDDPQPSRAELEATLARGRDVIESPAGVSDSKDEILAAGKRYLRALSELGALSPRAAVSYLDDARAIVSTCFDIIEHRPFARPAFQAARELTGVLLTTHREGEARRIASEMATRLKPLHVAIDLGDSMGETLAALDATGLLNATIAEQMKALAWASLREIDSSSLHLAIRIAVRFAGVTPAAAPHLSAAAAALVREDLRRATVSTWRGSLTEWYEPALQVVQSQLANGQDQPAADTARLLLEKASHETTLWLDRGAILGGLVRVQEPSTKKEALARFVGDDAFADHIDALPSDTLRQLSRELDAKQIG